MAYVGWSSVANQVNTTTGAALEVNGQVTSSLYFGAGVGGEGATNLMLAPSLNLNFALFGQDTLDPRINFSRTTNATVTNSAGLITYAPMNLLTYSEQFDNAAWVKDFVLAFGSGSVVNAVTAPNGTQTADLITPNTTTNYHRVYQSTSVSTTSASFSVYVKSNGYNKIGLRETASTGAGAAFDLSSGTVIGAFNAAGGTAGNMNIEPLSDGWFRISCTVTSATLITMQFGISFLPPTYVAGTDLLPTWTPNGVSGFYIWGAQFENTPLTTTYNSTTVKNLLGYSELFDNAAWTKSNSFVQTNLLAYSEAFDNAAWTKSNASISANNIIAPNGYQTAEKLIENTANSSHFTQQDFSAISGNVYTASYYVKVGERNWCFIIGQGVAFASSPYAFFNLQTGDKGAFGNGATNVNIIPVGNSWYRISMTVTAAAASPASLGLRLADANLSYTYTGDGTSGLYLWGSQLVQGSVAGDYRRTDAAALPVYYPNHNGVVCAEKLVENTVNTFHVLTKSETVLNGGKYTISLYVKAGERTWVDIAPAGLSNGDCWFNLATGTKVSTGSAVLSADIFPAGNGWYRCTITYVSNATSSGITVVPSQTGSVIAYQGDGTSGIYIFGAQLSDSASLDPYVLNAAAAPTAAAYYSARFDYDPVTLQPKGLLIEEQRSNLLTYSDDFANAAWTKSNATITANVIIAPNGSQTADKLIEDTANNSHAVVQTSSNTGGVFSFYAKAGERTFVFAYAETINQGRCFDLTNGTRGSIILGTPSDSSITPVGNGWYRCSITLASNTGAVRIGTCLSDGVFSYTGNGTSGLYIWGAQLEAGAFATSYIPTAASQVTRAADVATIQGSNFYSWYNQNEGSVVINADETSTAFSGNRKTLYTFTAGNFNNIIRNGIDSGTVASFNATYESAAQASLSISASYQANVFSKSSTAYKINDFYLNVNNGTATVDTSGTTPMSFFMDIGYGPQVSSGTGNTAGDFLNGHIKQISYYPQRLSDSVLKGLTA